MSRPRDESGAFTPKPRKDSEVSSSTAPAIANVAFTTITPIVLGSRCLKIRRPGLAPMATAAATNSFSRRDRTSPRTRRARDVQDTRPSTTASGRMPIFMPLAIWPSTAASTSSGMTMIRSVRRISTESTQPPK